MAQVKRSCAPHWIVRLGSASRCPDLVVVLAGSSSPVFDESLTPTDAPYPYLKTGLVTVIPFQRFMDHTFLLWSCANRLHSLSAALSQFARLAEHTDTLSSGVQDVVASAGFSVAFLRSVQAQAPVLSATVAAMGTPFRSPIPLPKRAPPQRASEPARGSVPPGLCDPLLEAVSGCLLDFSSLCRPGPCGRGGAATSASHLTEPTFISISQGQARRTGLTNPGPAVSSRRYSYVRSISRADSVAEARTTMRVFYNAPLRRQALVLSALAAQEIKRLLHQPRRMSFLPLAMVERLVTGVRETEAAEARLAGALHMEGQLIVFFSAWRSAAERQVARFIQNIKNT